MPEVKPARSRLLFKIELSVLFLLLLGIGWLSWSLLSDETKAQITGLPARLISSRQDFSASLASPLPLPSAPSTPKPSILPLPTGAQTYRFSIGKDVKGPKVKSLTLDPLTPSPGTQQTVTLAATHSSPITSVTIEVISDNKSTRHELIADNDSWQGSWQIDDTYNYKYGLRLILKSSDSTYDETIWFRP